MHVHAVVLEGLYDKGTIPLTVLMLTRKQIYDAIFVVMFCHVRLPHMKGNALNGVYHYEVGLIGKNCRKG